jgi:ribonuclease III
MSDHLSHNEKLHKLEETIGYHFNNRSLLLESLSHPSLKQYASNSKPSVNYERLELLGDAVLGFIITEIIYKNFTEYDEGKLAKIRSNLVCKDMLCRVAARINLAQFIIMTEGEESTGGRHNPNNIENAMEALIAAIYLDSNLETTQKVIKSLWQEFLNSKELSVTDAKTALQEWTQRHGFGSPLYRVVEKTGPAHLPNFIVSVTVGKYEQEAEGHAIKAAEKLAAKKMLNYITSKQEK